MGRNFYVREEPCPTCGRYEQRHIGKSSAGWCFALHVYPDGGICELEDWVKYWQGKKIIDEYGSLISEAEMLAIIDRRGRLSDQDPGSAPSGYKDWSDFHRANHSMFGPYHLLRARLFSGQCIGHGANGDGTWDLIVGDFS